MSKNDMLAAIVRALVGVPQARLGVVLDTVNKIGSADGELWRSRIAEVLREQVREAVMLPELPPDILIHVDRFICPVYPDWVKMAMHPELEPTGPVEYDLSTIDLWLHYKQKNGGYIQGNKLYEHLKDKKTLASCLSLRDGEEIQKKGLVVFRKFFGGKAVFLWKSIVQHRNGHLYVPFRNGHLYVPFLIEYNDEVAVDWYCLDNDWLLSPALRFAS